MQVVMLRITENDACDFGVEWIKHLNKHIYIDINVNANKVFLQ